VVFERVLCLSPSLPAARNMGLHPSFVYHPSAKYTPSTMAKNDTVLLDGIVEQRIADMLPSNRLDEVFEFFAFEQILKDYDLSRDEIESGWVDGRNDGGIDGFFVLVNGHLLRDPDIFTWPKKTAAIDVWIVTCKHHETFQQAPINAVLASIPELFDLGRSRAELKSAYSDELLNARALLESAYRKLSASRPTLSIHFVYASRGNAAEVAENIHAKAKQLIVLAETLFSSCDASFDFVGSAELVSSYRKFKRFSLSLPVLEYLAREQTGYIVLARLEAFYDFVKDESGALRRYLFDSNVRDYLGSSQVNEDILKSLGEPSAADFWWLNNGVTVLATSATAIGKTIQLEDIQIVNGLQTTETIFRYFSRGGTDTANRALLIKIVVSTDASVRDRIIRATNNQSVVELASLRATDKIQRDIEEILERHDWYYERRKNYYRNIGKPSSRFVTPLYIAAGYVALLFKSPVSAARLKTRFMQYEKSYSQVFSDNVPLLVWPVVVDVLKRTEEGLALVKVAEMSERFFSKWRNLIALIAVAKTLGTFAYAISEFVNFKADSIENGLVLEIWEMIRDSQKQQKREYRRHEFIVEICTAAASKYGIQGVEVLERKKLIVKRRKLKTKNSSDKILSNPVITEEILNQVDAALPEQPWKPGVHLQVASKVSQKVQVVHAAITELIRVGRRYHQKDGVVYAPDGSVLSKDPERAVEVVQESLSLIYPKDKTK